MGTCVSCGDGLPKFLFTPASPSSTALLWLDDDPVFMRQLQAWPPPLGKRIISVHPGGSQCTERQVITAAVAALHAHPDAILVVDNHIGFGDAFTGIDLVRILRGQNFTTRFVFCSGSGTVSIPDALLDSLGLVRLSKPFLKGRVNVEEAILCCQNGTG